MKNEPIRRKILKSREKLSKQTVKRNSKKILEKLFLTKAFIHAKKIMFYSSFRNEIDTEKMIEKSLELKKQVFLPKVIGDKIVPIQIENLKNLVLGKFGILEPRTTNHEPRTTNQLDVVVVPGVVFDRNCNRLGFGKGYFDRFLKKQNAVKIGLAHSLQIVEKIQISKNDVPMDLVITERHIFDSRIRHE